jgi:hypothetical protein
LLTKVFFTPSDQPLLFLSARAFAFFTMRSEIGYDSGLTIVFIFLPQLDKATLSYCVDDGISGTTFNRPGFQEMGGIGITP